MRNPMYVAAVAIELQECVYAVLHDISGNVAAFVNRMGFVAEVYRYSAYDEEQIFKPFGQPAAVLQLGNPWCFSLKCVYFGRRYYRKYLGEK